MADAHAEHGEHPPVVDVVEVSGFLDPVLVGMMVDTLEALDPAETVAVVFQVDSTASVCLLYTSDAADDTPCVDLGGRRII